MQNVVDCAWGLWLYSHLRTEGADGKLKHMQLRARQEARLLALPAPL